MHHFQQYILPQFSSNPLSTTPNILPITSHLSKYSDLYIPLKKTKPELKSNPSVSSFSVLTPTKKVSSPQSSKYIQQQQYYTTLFHQMQGSTEAEIANHIQEKKELEEEILSIQEENKYQIITTNTAYNMFITERKEIMKVERDQRVEREKEKDIERNGDPSSPFANQKKNSLRNPPNRGDSGHNFVFERRVVQFDKLSDMMIQVS